MAKLQDPPATYEEAVSRLNAQLTEFWQMAGDDPSKQEIVCNLADVLRRERPEIIDFREVHG